MKAGGQIGIEGTLCHQSTWCCVPLSLSPTMTTEVAVNAVPINFNINNELTLLAWFFASLALKPLICYSGGELSAAVCDRQCIGEIR